MAVERHNVSRRTVLGAGAAATVVVMAGPAPAADPTNDASRATAASSPSNAARTSSARVDFLCRQCGGNAVTRDAWAEWDIAEQEWVLGAAFDYAYCHDCQEETRLDEVDAAESADGERD
ncbi:MAG: hypothetical protein QOH47_2204 [Sphingomonadales bacterium]|jgi:hypothetical protein|nr:hypothetical protein [Sphingomonadales bacterium]